MIDQVKLGLRIQVAREACRMPQAEAASRLGVPLPEYEQIESGQRPISARELDRLAYLFGRDIRDFVADDFPLRDALADLLAAHAAGCSPTVLDEVRKCIALGREAMALERVLGSEQASSLIAAYLTRMLRVGEPDTAKVQRDFKPYLISLAMSAYRRDEISRARLRELVTMAGGSIEDLERLMAVDAPGRP